MLILLSPAKTLRPSHPPVGPKLPALSNPDAGEQAKQIMEALSKWSREELAVKMSLSEKLTDKVYDWHQTWALDSPFAAGLTFHGDAFKSLDLPSLPAHCMAKAQRSVRILHAVYGLLRPWDAYSPVRLEMGQPWSPDPAFGSMHSYWKGVLPSLVEAHMNDQGHDHILNLASAEYSQTALRGLTDDRIINCQFLEQRNGTLRSISAFAKAARGAMARFAILEGITNEESLRRFRGLGYGFNEKKSEQNLLVFTRTSPP